jgi:hypothetical protein
MKKLIMLAPAIALVAACARAPAGIQPGMWEYEVTTTAVEAPGLPAEVLQQAQSGLNQPQRNRECVTPDDAANPLGEMRDQLTRSQSASCQTSDNTFSGGVIRFRASCRGSGGAQGQLQWALNGRFAAITLLADVEVDAEVPNPSGSGTLTLRTRGTLKGRRIGSCPL